MKGRGTGLHAHAPGKGRAVGPLSAAAARPAAPAGARQRPGVSIAASRGGDFGVASASLGSHRPRRGRVGVFRLDDERGSIVRFAVQLPRQRFRPLREQGPKSRPPVVPFRPVRAGPVRLESRSLLMMDSLQRNPRTGRRRTVALPTVRFVRLRIGHGSRRKGPTAASEREGTGSAMDDSDRSESIRVSGFRFRCRETGAVWISCAVLPA